jgi:quinol monooxygenase YgiN
MFVVTVLFEVADDRIEDFHRAVLVQARNSLEREALYEIYDDAPAFDRHLASDHFRDFDAVVAPWVRTKKVETWDLMPG